MSKELKHITDMFPDKTNPFKTPEGYFDTLTDRIMNQVDLQENKGKSKHGIIRYLKPALAMAASFVIVFMLVYFPVKSWGPKMANSNEHEYYNQDMLLYMVSENIIYEEYYAQAEEKINDEVLESVLIASVSEMDLMNLK